MGFVNPFGYLWYIYDTIGLTIKEKKKGQEYLKSK